MAILTSPVLVYARSGEKVTLLPNVEPAQNSQMIALLEGYLNLEPAGVGGPSLAIVDGTTLDADSGETDSSFIEAGTAGGGEISVYIVREGDTLSEIAEMFGVSTNTIIWANDIKKANIRVWQELVILPISGVRHTVKSGDTLKTIATKYKADFEEILAYNGLASDAKIKAGDVVLVPNGVAAVTQSSTGSSVTVNTGGGVSAGYFIRPIASGKKSQGVHGHNGVDLAAPVGTPVVAAAGGKVIISRSGGYNGGYGTYVVISHPNGTQTLYAHLGINHARVGAVVEKGEAIGAIGMTGRTTGPHLHFEVRGAKNPF